MLDIWLWLARDNLALADDVLDRVDERLKQLADFPELGVARPDIAPGARSLLVERWLVLYHLNERGVNVVRIVDGVRDLSRAWKE